MAVSLPVAMSQAKEANSNFFIELYTIQLPTYELNIASCDEDIEFNGKRFMGYPIKRGEITKTVDSRVDNCEITVSNTNDYFTLLLFNGKNFLGHRVYIYKILYPDSLEDPSIVFPVFYGQIDSPKLTADGTFTCSVVSDIPNMDNCRTMGYNCSNYFGDANCKMEVKKTSGSCTIGWTKYGDYVRQYVQSDSLGSTYWGNGIVTIDGESRRAIGTETNRVYLEYPFPSGIDKSKGFSIQQDCDKTPASCEVYKNRKHYAGFLAVPFEFTPKT